MKIVKNSCFGGFGLSDEAYEKLIEYGIPVGKYHEEPRNPKTGLYDIPMPGTERNILTSPCTISGTWTSNCLILKKY